MNNHSTANNQSTDRQPTADQHQPGPTTKMIYGQLGSISSSTLKTEDLLSVFSATLYELARLNQNVQGLIEESKNDLRLVLYALKMLDSASSDDWYNDDKLVEDASMLVMDISDALDNYAMPYCYFGTEVSGDNANFGFWIDHELAAEDVQTAEIHSVKLAEAPLIHQPPESIDEFPCIMLLPNGEVYGYLDEAGDWLWSYDDETANSLWLI